MLPELEILQVYCILRMLLCRLQLEAGRVPPRPLALRLSRGGVTLAQRGVGRRCPCRRLGARRVDVRIIVSRRSRGGRGLRGRQLIGEGPLAVRVLGHHSRQLGPPPLQFLLGLAERRAARPRRDAAGNAAEETADVSEAAPLVLLELALHPPNLFPKSSLLALCGLLGRLAAALGLGLPLGARSGRGALRLDCRAQRLGVLGRPRRERLFRRQALIV